MPDDGPVLDLNPSNVGPSHEVRYFLTIAQLPFIPAVCHLAWDGSESLSQ